MKLDKICYRLLNFFVNPLKIIFQYESVGGNRPTDSNSNDWLGEDDEPLIGFETKNLTEKTTKGFWIWSDVFLCEVNGDKIAILLMDTEGFSDHASEKENNKRIFALSTLISSVQIFNLCNYIDAHLLQYLRFATELMEIMQTNGESIAPFQKMVFLLRDWNEGDWV